MELSQEDRHTWNAAWFVVLLLVPLTRINRWFSKRPAWQVRDSRFGPRPYPVPKKFFFPRVPSRGGAIPPPARRSGPETANMARPRIADVPGSLRTSWDRPSGLWSRLTRGSRQRRSPCRKPSVLPARLGQQAATFAAVGHDPLDQRPEAFVERGLDLMDQLVDHPDTRSMQAAGGPRTSGSSASRWARRSRSGSQGPAPRPERARRRRAGRTAPPAVRSTVLGAPYTSRRNASLPGQSRRRENSAAHRAAKAAVAPPRRAGPKAADKFGPNLHGPPKRPS